MYEVSYSVDGVIHKMMINASDTIAAQEIVTNMFGKGKVQILSCIRRS